jgi:hypothetical protein
VDGAPDDQGGYRPDRVLVINTVEYYMTVGHKVWDKQLFVRGYEPTSWLVYEEDCGSPTRGGPIVNPMYLERFIRL